VGEPVDTEPNDDPATAQPISLGGSENGTLLFNGDDDWFSFFGEPGMEVRIELFHTGNSYGTSDYTLRLFRPDMFLLDISITSPSGETDYEKAEATLSTTGTHYVEVSAGNWVALVNGYRIESTWVNQPAATETPTATFTPWIPVTGVDGGTWEIYR